MEKSTSFNEEAVVFYTKLNQLLEEYAEVKESIILAEKFDPEERVYIAPLNELRSAFDHIMRACHKPSEVEKQFEEAQSHIRRAGYDAYELFSVSIITNQINIVKKYDSNVIAKIFPEYYTEVKPTINRIKEQISSIRAHNKMISTINHTHFAEYFGNSKKLIEISNLISMKIPGLEEYSRDYRAEKSLSARWYWFWTILLGVLLTLGGYLAGRYLNK